MKTVLFLLALGMTVFFSLACAGDDAPDNGEGVWRLTITRADGTGTVIELRERPIVCDMDRDRGIVWLCGVNLEGIAVDFIQVNESLGETYPIQAPSTPTAPAATASPTATVSASLTSGR